MKYLEVDPDAYYALQDAIVPHALLESLEDGVDTIQRLESMDELARHQQEDLRHYKEYIPALVKVLEWWTATGSPERRKLQEILDEYKA